MTTSTAWVNLPVREIRGTNETAKEQVRNSSWSVVQRINKILGSRFSEERLITEGRRETSEEFLHISRNSFTRRVGMEQRSAYSFEATPDLDALADAQGVSPIHDIDELVADFWPEDESIEDFIATVREWRSEGHAPNS